MCPETGGELVWPHRGGSKWIPWQSGLPGGTGVGGNYA